MSKVRYDSPGANLLRFKYIEPNIAEWGIACENSRFPSLLAAGAVSQGGTSATQRQKFHTVLESRQFGIVHTQQAHDPSNSASIVSCRLKLLFSEF